MIFTNLSKLLHLNNNYCGYKIIFIKLKRAYELYKPEIGDIIEFKIGNDNVIVIAIGRMVN